MEVGDDSLFDHVSSVSAWPLIGPPMMNPCRFTRNLTMTLTGGPMLLASSVTNAPGYERAN